MDEITILDKTYISSKRAAEITGYAKDYVGQLCREGHVDAKMVGRSWYVFEPSIRKHRFGEEAVVEVESPAEPYVQENSVPTVPEAAAWEPSLYKAEPVELIPELEIPIRNQNTEQSAASEANNTPSDTQTTLTDMQSAWREWFERKQDARIEAPETELMLPSAYDDDELLLEAPESKENEDEFDIPIHKIEDTEEIEENFEESVDFAVPIQRMDSATPVASPAPVMYERPAATYSHAAESAPEASIGVIRKEKIVKRSTKPTKAGKRTTRTNAPAIAGLIAIAFISLAVAAVGTGYAERYLSGQVVNNPAVNFLVGNTEFKR